MAAKPEISVILPTRRRHHLLPRALQSLFAQTFKNFEIILVDDNPAESRVSQQPSLQSLLADARIRLLENPKPQNAASARNVGLAVARGTWITYLDDDDAYQPTKLEKQWRTAQQRQWPIGLCGLNYHLKFRTRQRQVSCEAFSGPDLLLSAVADTKVIFHRQTNEVCFNEDLYAVEDAYFFHCLLRHFQVESVFNVPEALVDVYPQPGVRVNTNPEGMWKATQAIYKEFSHAYGDFATEVFWARSRLGYLKLKKGGWWEAIQVARRLVKLGGRQEGRFVLNAFGFKIPWARRWLVG